MSVIKTPQTRFEIQIWKILRPREDSRIFFLKGGVNINSTDVMDTEKHYQTLGNQNIDPLITQKGVNTVEFW